MGRSGLSALCLSATVIFTVEVTAQDTFQFRYRPPVGYRLSVVSGVAGTLTVRGLPGTGQNQNLRFEAIAASTDVSREDLGGASLVETSFDSIFGRYQSPANATWVELPIPYQPVGTLEQIRDSTYASTMLESVTDPFFLNASRGLRMRAELPVPALAVGTGSTWPVEFPFPFTSQIPSDSALLITVDFVARGTARLDSIVARTADTLAFVSMTASLDPVLLENAYSFPRGDLPVSMTGSLNGSHIWSTGWHGWAGSLLNVIVEHQVEGLPGAGMTTNVVSSARVTS